MIKRKKISKYIYPDYLEICFVVDVLAPLDDIPVMRQVDSFEGNSRSLLD